MGSAKNHTYMSGAETVQLNEDYMLVCASVFI